MKYSNCLIGVIILACRYKFRGKLIILRNSCIPHLGWLHRGILYDYQTKEDIFPWPFCFILFKGAWRQRNWQSLRN